MVFSGRVQFRSSSGPLVGTGPPGESAVQRLNPGREQRVRAATGWPALAPGSLNLEVDDSVLNELARRSPTLVEPANDIVYPERYKQIPKCRRAYWYYRGLVEKDGLSESVLVRRAENPVPGRVELFSAVGLKERFNLKAGDSMNVKVLEPVRDIHTVA